MDTLTPTPLYAPRHDGQHLEAALSVSDTFLATWSSTPKVVSPSSTENQNASACHVVRANPFGLASTIQVWDTELTCEFGQTLQQHEGWLSAVGVWRHETHGNNVFSGCNIQRKPKELWIEKVRGTVDPVDLMQKHLDVKSLTMLRSLLSINHISGRPSSAPTLCVDTEKISRASRALAAVSFVRRTAATEMTVSSANEHGLEMIAGGGTNFLNCRRRHERGNHDLLYDCGIAVDVSKTTLVCNRN